MAIAAVFGRCSYGIPVPHKILGGPAWAGHHGTSGVCSWVCPSSGPVPWRGGVLCSRGGGALSLQLCWTLQGRVFYTDPARGREAVPVSWVPRVLLPLVFAFNPIPVPFRVTGAVVLSLSVSWCRCSLFRVIAPRSFGVLLPVPPFPWLQSSHPAPLPAPLLRLFPLP